MLMKKKILFSAATIGVLAAAPAAATFGLFGSSSKKTTSVSKPQPYSYSSKGYGTSGWGKTNCNNPCGGSTSGGSTSGGHTGSTGGSTSGGHTGSTGGSTGGSSGGPVSVPEPGMFGLMGAGIAALGLRRIRRLRRRAA